jgi:polysaccharide export outer membrane protein
MHGFQGNGTRRALRALAWLILCAASAHAAAQSMREVLGPGDTVRITAVRHPDLTTEARVADDGSVNVPLVGPVPVGGKTPKQAATQIARLLKEGSYLVNPQIDVMVLEARSRQVSVLGFVNRPGRYMLEGANAKVTDVLAMAGGLMPDASDSAIITREREGKSESVSVDLAAIIQRGDAQEDVEVASGDSVFVPKAPVVYVYGEVTRAGSYRMEPGMTVMQAISVAGGITPRGSESRIKLRRRGEDGKWKETNARPQDRVRANDVINVRESIF